MAEDWENIRRNAFCPGQRPTHWPHDVSAISMQGIMLFGLDKKHRLYWDGEKVRTEIKLTSLQCIAATATVLAAVIGAAASGIEAYVAWMDFAAKAAG